MTYYDAIMIEYLSQDQSVTFYPLTIKHKGKLTFYPTLLPRGGVSDKITPSFLCAKQRLKNVIRVNFSIMYISSQHMLYRLILLPCPPTAFDFSDLNLHIKIAQIEVC